jgi:hypothetical protein
MAPEDLYREVRAVFDMRDAGDADANFCEARRGLSNCDRHHRHHGRHAAGVALQTVRFEGVASLLPTKVVRW